MNWYEWCFVVTGVLAMLVVFALCALVLVDLWRNGV